MTVSLNKLEVELSILVKEKLSKSCNWVYKHHLPISMDRKVNFSFLRHSNHFQTLWTTALMVLIIKAWFMAWLILPVFHVRLAGYKDGCKYLWFILLGVFPKKRRVVWSSLLLEKRCRQEGFFWYFSLSVWVLRLEIWLVVVANHRSPAVVRSRGSNLECTRRHYGEIFLGMRAVDHA